MIPRWRGPARGPLSQTLSVVSRSLVFLSSCSTLFNRVARSSGNLVIWASVGFNSEIGSPGWYYVPLRVVLQQGCLNANLRHSVGGQLNEA